ncbi:universal stress protein [Corynebacterium sp. A21]|uniref:universal stress protein n=1 Tax=Corynebacterium sp. A21 TaxID=3457318 RepID=UPI003FD64392
MKKYSTIAVGTDGSDSALEAVKTAASLATVYEAELVIICAYFNNTGSLLGSRQADATSIPVVSQENAQEFLREAQQAAETEGAQRVTLRDVSGVPVEALLHTLDEVKADLLVVGNRGVNSLTGRVFGSIPTGVSRKAHVDVMLVNTSDGR